MLRMAFDFIITWRETRTRPNAYTDTVLQAYTLIECLEREVFDERYAVYLSILLTFAPNSTDLVSLPLTMGRT